MTKRQMLAACVAIAPDFRMVFDSPGNVPTVTVTCSTSDGPLAFAMTVGGLGRAAVETRLLEAALSRLRRKAA